MAGVLEAAFWGFVGGAALLVGAVLGLYAGASRRLMAVVMALGAGVLLSSVAFELMEEAYRIGGLDAAAPGLLLGAAVFYFADREVNRRGGERRKNAGDRQGGSAAAIAIGALLDGIPESAAIGISLIEGGGVGVALVAAVFLSNVPEGLSSAAGMKRAGRSPAYVLGLWGAVTLASTLAALLGYLFLAGASGNVVAGIQSFAAGAILTMLASTMMPEAYEDGGPVVGVVTTVGFLLAFVLSRVA
ncbi:MAG: ZIP family zinc transporter [Actinomycetota bacterium]|nr:ZIP family zinc transporter [Actinomycetota bacterium]MDQ3376214.1 ZIP family zinc transporter [Actinomycetota bacterium]